MADFPIVGIGSSAGGLEALQTLFRGMPADSGMAFVVAAHLDPTQESHLSELLSRCTSMPVVQIEHSMEVEPDHVYVIAPDQELAIRKGVIHTNKPTAPRGHRHPVDSFLRSLAEDQGERAIAIILSGTGTNGTLGLRFIKAEGGIAIAQEPESAGFPGMPRSAISTGIVDLVLAADRMPDALSNLARQPYVREAVEALVEDAPENQLQALLTLVRASTGQDFRSYRKRTLMRRIHRRMSLHRIEGLSSYIDRLRDDPKEVGALAADLTINVTGFFRDPEAWKVLTGKVIAPMVQERPTGSTIRVWVPGCSTGEEAYSIAMVIQEQAEAARKTFEVRLFATDVAEGVLSAARAGLYPASVAQDVTPERLERWFEMEDDAFAIRKALRESITFAPQNLLQDPPFSRLDLISCRNLLIYLEPEHQRRVLDLFHFALREGGHLFLGPSETVAGREDLFRPISRKWRIFRRLGPTRRDLVDLPLIRPSEQETHAEPGREPRLPQYRGSVGELMDRALLERYVPASVLVDRHFRVHYLRGPTEDYLRPPSGEPTYNLISMAREGLQPTLRGLVRKAVVEGQEVTADGRVRRSGSWHAVRVVAAPFRPLREGDATLLVSFVEREPAADPGPPQRAEAAASGDELQTELDAAREDLRLTVEQMDAANEELMASNEEIRSINEELQASNEELETSKEELQSLNEELNTVNSQLQAKVAELEARTDDLNNLLNSTDVATLFLDRSLCIRWFTPSMKALLDLLPSDIGRPISHFAQRFSGGNLLGDARTVLERLRPSDAEVVDDLGRWYIRHIVPYRTAADRIAGVVVTFVDITERKHSEEAVRRSEERLRRVLEVDAVGVLFLDENGTLVDANHAFLDMTGYTRREVKARELSWRAMTPPEWMDASAAQMSRLQATGRIGPYEKEYFCKDGSRLWLLFAGSRLDDGTLVEYCIDISDRKRAEEALRESEERYRTLFNSIDEGFCTIEVIFDEQGQAVDYRFLTVNAAFERQTGLTASVGKTIRSFAPNHEEFWFETYGQIALTGESRRFEHSAADLGHYYEVYAFRIGEPGERRVGVLFNDVGERKRAEEERELLSRELSHRVKNTLAVVQSLALQTDGHARSTEDWRQAFVGRLQALGRAHDLLLEAQWRGADLKHLVEQAVAAYRIDRPEVVEVEGPSVRITAKQALGLNLILHELGTNAAKYGALSRSEGRVLVSWKVESGQSRRVRLRWQESHGPRVEAPADKRFGTRLIERACSYELDGGAELEYAPEGLSCELVFPLQ